MILFTLISLGLANSKWSGDYLHFWHLEIGGHGLGHWVNDGLMTLFFLLVGLELEREIYIGELSEPRKALLPILAALGGMLVPAGIHLLLNANGPYVRGAGIPMATDIAFSLGMLSLLGTRIPFALKVFLTALAIADDLGAVAVIAIFYSDGISWIYLGGAVALFVALYGMGKMGVRILLPYLAGGVVLWWLMLQSGMHATLAGVLLAFAIPFGKGGENSLSYRLQHSLHLPVAFVILPIFALANTAIVIQPGWETGVLSSNGWGIMLGLVIGKPLGILVMCGLAVLTGWCKLPEGVRWSHIVGAGIMAGIGFTMSIFVAVLAFDDLQVVAYAQMSILFASAVAIALGLGWFLLFTSKVTEPHS